MLIKNVKIRKLLQIKEICKKCLLKRKMITNLLKSGNYLKSDKIRKDACIEENGSKSLFFN